MGQQDDDKSKTRSQSSDGRVVGLKNVKPVGIPQKGLNFGASEGRWEVFNGQWTTETTRVLELAGNSSKEPGMPQEQAGRRKQQI